MREKFEQMWIQHSALFANGRAIRVEQSPDIPGTAQRRRDQGGFVGFATIIGSQGK